MNTYTTTIQLDKKYNDILIAMSLSAKALYNSMLFISRQNFFNHENNKKSTTNIKFEKSFTDFKSPDVYKYVKENFQHYHILPNSISQNTCLSVMQDFRSFLGLLKLKNQGKYNNKVNIPHYKKKDKLFSLMFSKGNIVKNDNKITLTTPKSITYFDVFKEKEITLIQNDKISFILPPYLNNINIKYIEIIYSFGNFSANVVYKKKENFEDIKLEENNFLAIDLGINNFATTLFSDGETLIYNGKGLKSSNQFFNKIKAKLMSRKDKTNSIKEQNSIQKQLHRISQDRKGFIKTKLATIGKDIIKKATEKQVSTIVVGLNKEWKQNCNIGKINNLPHLFFIFINSCL